MVSLYFKHVNGDNVFVMECNSTDTIKVVKMRLQDAEGLTPEKIILRLKPTGELLDNLKTLNDYHLDRVDTRNYPIEISLKNETGGGGRKRRRRTKRRRTKRKGSKKRSRRTRKRR